jgi:glycerol uptake facilitator-like aquaporin
MGPLSGLHINPAVTFAFAARRVFPRTWILPCWMAQFAGAIAAAVFRQGYSYGTSREGFQPGTVRQLIVVTGPGRDLPAIREGCHVKDR